MKRIPRPLGVAMTFLLVAFGWVLFRAETLHRAGGFYLLLFGLLPGGEGLAAFPEVFDDRALWLVAAIAIPCAFAPAFRLDRFLPRDPENPDALPIHSVLVRFILSLLILVVTACELCASDFNPFIYFRF
jgi:alginate O-acetyltransferase complex protein AlgI